MPFKRKEIYIFYLKKGNSLAFLFLLQVISRPLCISAAFKPDCMSQVNHFKLVLVLVLTVVVSVAKGEGFVTCSPTLPLLFFEVILFPLLMTSQF